LGSSAALKNLLSGRPEAENLYSLLVGLPVKSSSSGEGHHRSSRSRTVEEQLDDVLTESHLKTDNISTVSGRRDDRFVFSVTDIEKKRQRRTHSLSRAGSRESVRSQQDDRSSSNGERKHSSNLDLTSSEDPKEDRLIGKFACSYMKDDTEGDLNFHNEAISTVDELLEVVKDMASLRLNEDSKKEGGEQRSEAQLEIGNTTESCRVVDEESEERSSVERGQISGEHSMDERKSQDSGRKQPVRNESSSVELSSTPAEKDKHPVESGAPASMEKLNGELIPDKCTSDFTARVELSSSAEETPSEELASTEEHSVPKNVSIVSPEDLPIEERTEGSSLAEKESLEEFQHSSEELSSDEVVVKKELPTPEEFGELQSDEVAREPKEELPTPEEFGELQSDEVAREPKEELPTPEEFGELHSDEVAREPKEELPIPEEFGELQSDGVARESKEELPTPEELGRSLEELTFEEDVKKEMGCADLESEKGEAGREPSPEVYGDYAETDLDQPTDYSLQYGEEDELSDEDEVRPSTKREAPFYVTNVPISIHEDTVKTYCTEGTPFETPYNFSTATSMSDLRAEPSIKEELDEGSETASVDQRSSAGPSAEVKAELSEETLLLDRIHSMNCGLPSPAEKPVQFCEEGTPGQCISRFSSLSSLCGDINAESPQLKGAASRGSCSPYMNGATDHAKRAANFSTLDKNGKSQKFFVVS